jgi:hypothetical protein
MNTANVSISRLIKWIRRFNHKRPLAGGPAYVTWRKQRAEIAAKVYVQRTHRIAAIPFRCALPLKQQRAFGLIPQLA